MKKPAKNSMNGLVAISLILTVEQNKWITVNQKEMNTNSIVGGKDKTVVWN